MSIITKEKGGIWEAQVQGSAGKVFGPTEDVVIYRAETWPILHKKPHTDRPDVWRPSPNFGVLSNANWFNKCFPGGLG
jgi:hypothetical protein